MVLIDLIEFVGANAAYVPFWIIVMIVIVLAADVFPKKEDISALLMVVGCPFWWGAYIYDSELMMMCAGIAGTLAVLIHCIQSNNYIIFIMMMIVMCAAGAASAQSSTTLHQSFNSVSSVNIDQDMESQIQVVRITGTRMVITRRITVVHNYSDAALKVLVDANAYNVTAVVRDGRHDLQFNGLRAVIRDAEIVVSYTLYVPHDTVITNTNPLAELQEE